MRWQTFAVMAAVLITPFQVHAGGLPNNPDLIYTASSGNVQIDADGAVVGSFFLQSNSGQFLPPADFGDLDADVGLAATNVNNTATTIGWISRLFLAGTGYDGPGLADLGNIFPVSLDMAELDALLSDDGWGQPGGGGGNFDLIIDTPMVLVGDYNGDDVVNLADYTVWRDNLGGTSLPNNETESIGVVDSADYDAWKTNFGAVAAAASVSVGQQPIPEPSAVPLAMASVFAGYVSKTKLRPAKRR